MQLTTCDRRLLVARRWRRRADAGRQQERDRSARSRTCRGRSPASASRSRNGMQMRVDEINEQGGVNGRKLKLVVEDSWLRPEEGGARRRRSWCTQDKIFAMAGPHRHAAEHGGDADPVREEHPSTSSRSPLRARCTSRSTSSSTRSPRPTSTRCALVALPGQAERVQEGLHDVPGRRVRPRSAARCRGRPEERQHDAGREVRRTSAAPPTFRRRSRA